MPLSIDIKIEEHREIAFPKRCMLCGSECGSEVARIRANPTGWYGMFPWLLGRTKRLAIPAHAACGKKLRRSILRRNLLLLVVVAIALVVVLRLEMEKLPAMATLVVSALIPVIWQVIYPPAFEFTNSRGLYELSFRDKSYAREFADLNGLPFEHDA